MSRLMIEGDLIPIIRIEEGPFGEYVDYHTSPRERRNVYRVRCITYRNNPILTMARGCPPMRGSSFDPSPWASKWTDCFESREYPLRTSICILNPPITS